MFAAVINLNDCGPPAYFGFCPASRQPIVAAPQFTLGVASRATEMTQDAREAVAGSHSPKQLERLYGRL